MAEDREVLREAWDGRVPAGFSLASQEVSRRQNTKGHGTNKTPPSFFPGGDLDGARHLLPDAAQDVLPAHRHGQGLAKSLLLSEL